MAKVVNLNQARKRLAKLVDKRKSDQNAIRHGLPKHERRQQQLEKELVERRFAGNRLSTSAPANEASERQDATILAWPGKKASTQTDEATAENSPPAEQAPGGEE